MLLKKSLKKISPEYMGLNEISKRKGQAQDLLLHFVHNLPENIIKYKNSNKKKTYNR